MGALTPPQDASSSLPAGSSEKQSGSEKQQQGQHYPYQPMPPPQGQYPLQFYPLSSMVPCCNSAAASSSTSGPSESTTSATTLAMVVDNAHRDGSFS
ncbi:hypothetical protein RJ641_003491 [Dillenia turbinata]|uniref:Uncharacterized protein n=1 Tax=Dillenia turbinata TaxID=194707 RepID=A0AAN8ZF97_9MAGN